MNILILHNKYQIPGGEDSVVAAESVLLREAGHNVHTEIVSNEKISSFQDKLSTFLHASYDGSRTRWINELVTQTGAEIVHIHNFFPLLTPAVHVASARRGVAVVQTLHNYRILCANSLFLRDGSVCEKCLDGSKVWSVVHRCYRNSLAGSLAVARMQWRANREQIWHKHVHRFIALSQFAKGTFVAGGLQADRISVKPNFVPDPSSYRNFEPRQGLLFVGRLSSEKGVEILLRAVRNAPDLTLTVAGTGPESDKYKSSAPPRVRFTGHLSRDEVLIEMAKAKCLIVPSICYENLPINVLEAFASGLPVIASKLGSLAEIIVDGINGLHFAPGDANDLTAKLTALLRDPNLLTRLRVGARASYERMYTPESNLSQLENVYRIALDTARTNNNDSA